MNRLNYLLSSLGVAALLAASTGCVASEADSQEPHGEGTVLPDGQDPVNEVGIGPACDDGPLFAFCGETTPPPPEPTGPLCGNGIVEGDEYCDDGNADETDECTTDCHCPTDPTPPNPNI